jgi:1,4-dihydroxy-2-naphthoyl-CoA hydrolase
MSIWYRPLTLEQVQQIHALGDDFLRGDMPVDDRTRQPFGLLHGGANVVLAETLGSLASNFCLETPRFYSVGQEISASHLRSARSGRVTGTARPIHMGGRSHVWEVRIEDEAGRLSCISRLTMAVVEAQGQPHSRAGSAA